MTYKLVTSRNQLDAIMKEIVKRAEERTDERKKYFTEYFYITNVNLAKEVYDEPTTGSKCDKFVTNPDSRLKFKTDKAQAKIMWYCEAHVNLSGNGYFKDKEPHLLNFRPEPATLILYKGVLFLPSFYRSEKTASFEIFNDDTNYQPIHNSEFDPVPNKMGTITESGMEAWYQYLIKRQVYANRVNSENDNKWNTLKSQIIAYAAKFGLNPPVKGQKGASYNEHGSFWIYESGLSGWLALNGVQMAFSYDRDSGHISTEIKLATSGKSYDNLEKFKRLTHNDWCK